MNNPNNIQRYSSFSKAFSSIAFLLISSYSYSQTYTDYYFIPTTGGDARLNLAQNYAVGSPDGEVASGNSGAQYKRVYFSRCQRIHSQYKLP